MYPTKTNCYIAFEDNEKYHLRYVRNEQPLTQFYNYLLNNLNQRENIETIFNLNSDITFLHQPTIQMNAENIDNKIYYKKISKNEEKYSKKELEEKMEFSIAIYCIFQENCWHVINHKVLDTYSLLDLNFPLSSFEKMISLKFLLNAKNFATKNLDKKSNLSKHWVELKKLYLENILNDPNFLQAKYSWWNHFILDKHSLNEPDLFPLLKVEIEKDRLESNINLIEPKLYQKKKI